MWWAFAFLSALFLGIYDAFKKAGLRDNPVLPVLLANTLFCSLLVLPMTLRAPFGGWEVQRYILLKSAFVLSSWVAGYYAIKHLPLTLVGPVNATRPVLVLVGAMLLYGERLNAWQWAGVALAAGAFLLLSRSGKREGIDFAHNRWVACLVLAALIGACCGLYDRFLMMPAEMGGVGLSREQVLGWYYFYQFLMMLPLAGIIWWPHRHRETPFRWSWAIPCISLFLVAGDWAYLQALTDEAALVAVVTMIRRGSVLVSFLLGAWLFREKNLRSKALDLLLVLLGMVCLYLGSR